jgi:prenyltransferase beta subunit
VSGQPIRRALDYLRTARDRDGGFALIPGREADAQSTAWAIQAFLAAKAAVPSGAFSYLRSLRRPDGSYRYSRRYVTTPVWVTAQVLPAVSKKPFPIR